MNEKTKELEEHSAQIFELGCMSCPVKMQEDDVVAEKDNEIRRMKRALWLARAEKAKTAKNMFDILWKFASREKVGVTGCAHKIKGAKTLKEPKFFFAKFQIAENKCIEKEAK